MDRISYPLLNYKNVDVEYRCVSFLKRPHAGRNLHGAQIPFLARKNRNILVEWATLERQSKLTFST